MADLLSWKDSNVYFAHVNQQQEFTSKASECPGRSEPRRKSGNENQMQQHFGSPQGENGRTVMNFHVEDDDGFVVQSIEPLYLGRVNGSHPTDVPKRISVRDFSVPKFTMRLAANQGNPKQLAALLAAKQTKEKRILRPKLENRPSVIPQQEMSASLMDQLGTAGKTGKNFVFLAKPESMMPERQATLINE